ncbi:antirestriction protein ArdA [Anaerotruncus rubiinfantis]|uniref:antirestriction protein ArdA n=1 Tax=Anaerotruncus rubiinfantis TaxID=1720200 RepID=UPI0034A5A9A1
MDAPIITGYITNLSAYSSGYLLCEPLAFPTTTERVQECLKKIRLDGIYCEEYFFSEYLTPDYPHLSHLPDSMNLDELNYLASLVAKLGPEDKEKFRATLQQSEYTSNPADLINLTQNLDCFDLYPNVKDAEDLGRLYVEERRHFDLPQAASIYFDFEMYGSCESINENGEFTSKGYIHNNGNPFIDYYDGKHIPEEYRVFAYSPKERRKPPKVTPHRQPER